MIEEKATVTRLSPGKIWLKSMQSSACSGCGQQSSCASATIAKAMPQREFEIDCNIELKVGDQVIVAINNDEKLLFSAFLLYMTPLLVMLAGSFAVITIFPGVDSDIWLPAFAMLFLLASFWLIHRFQSKILFYFYVKPELIGKAL